MEDIREEFALHKKWSTIINAFKYSNSSIKDKMRGITEEQLLEQLFKDLNSNNTSEYLKMSLLVFLNENISFFFEDVKR